MFVNNAKKEKKKNQIFVFFQSFLKDRSVLNMANGMNCYGLMGRNTHYFFYFSGILCL